MYQLYLLSVWLHVLAAIAWVGGMFFLVLVVVPWLRKGGRNYAAILLRETGERFRNVGWACFAVVLVTGTYNLWFRGVRFENFVDPGWLRSPFGKAVTLKLTTFAAVIVVSAIHDFVVGPRAMKAVLADPESEASARARKSASRLGRFNAVLALMLVAFAVCIVRGCP